MNNITINVIAIGIMIGLSGCEPTEGYESDRRNLEGCEPTGLYVYERNPYGVRQIYDCGEDKRSSNEELFGEEDE